MHEEASHPTILFDGTCNLCERSVRFVIRNDRNANFRFAALQSEAAQKLLAGYQHAGNELGSVVLVTDSKSYQKSRAVLQIFKRLDGAWPLIYYLFFWAPQFIANPIYDFIGNRRYKWFGVKDECWLPSDDLRRRFLDGLDETDGTC